MTVSLSKLRANLFQIVDQVIATGQPVNIERKGKQVQIVAIEPKSKLDNLVPHSDYLVGDPDDIVHMDWSGEWHEEQNL